MVNWKVWQCLLLCWLTYNWQTDQLLSPLGCLDLLQWSCKGRVIHGFLDDSSSGCSVMEHPSSSGTQQSLLLACGRIGSWRQPCFHPVSHTPHDSGRKLTWLTGSASSIRVALMETSFSVMASFDILRWLQNLIRQNETSRGRQPKYIEMETACYFGEWHYFDEIMSDICAFHSPLVDL